MSIEKGFSQYAGIGEVPFIYISLAPLKNKIVELPPRTQFHRYGKPVSAKKVVDIPLKKLHGIVTNFSIRPKWIFGLRQIKTRSDNLSTIGSKHLCLMPTNSMEFVTTAQHIEEGMIEYVEQSNNIKWFAPLNVVFVIKRISANTSSIAIQVHYRRNWLSKLGLDFPLRWMMGVVARVSLGKLKHYISTMPA